MINPETADMIDTEDLPFKDWMWAVDRYVLRTAGVSVHDLADQCWYDMWENGYPANEAGDVALEDEGFPF